MRPFADNLHYRLATPADIPHFGPLIETSIRGLQENDYSPFQIDQAIVTRHSRRRPVDTAAAVIRIGNRCGSPAGQHQAATNCPRETSPTISSST
jgi:hypothetical protein